MIRDLALDAELAKPAIGEVHLHLATQQPLRSQAKNIADDQHSDHQHRIHRRPAKCRIVRLKFYINPGQIKNSVDLAYQMILGNCLIEAELVEKRTLIAVLTSHHRPSPTQKYR